MNSDKEQTTVGGLRAIELYYRSIREISTGRTAFYQSRTQLNTPALGTIMPEVFRELADLTMQSAELFPLELIQAMEASNTFSDREIIFDWVSVYMPLSVLKDSGSEHMLLEYCDKYEIMPGRICFSLPEKLLTEGGSAAAHSIKNLRNRGFHFMITGFGGSACPFMRLSEYQTDYVMMSPEVTNYIERDERSENAVRSIVGFINDIGSEPVADGVHSSKQAEALYSFGCNYCAGALSGKYTAERYVRRNNKK